jgi:hypothetical protein
MDTIPKPINELLQPGDLVRVKEGTHAPQMPESRTGLIVEVVGTSGINGIYMVKFGTSILRFHGMFLERIT